MYSKGDLVKHLQDEAKVLRNPLVLGAFQGIDRANFVPLDYQVEAYEDYPLPIGHGQTISQSTTVAFMLEKLDAGPGDRVLDVGSGSGWTTALLAHIVGESGSVVGVERIPELVKLGVQNLAKYNFKHAQITEAGEILGKPDEAPFDRILVSASAVDEAMADELLLQLKEGGKMVIPVRDSVVVYEKSRTGEISRRDFPGFAFVPLVEKN